MGNGGLTPAQLRTKQGICAVAKRQVHQAHYNLLEKAGFTHPFLCIGLVERCLAFEQVFWRAAQKAQNDLNNGNLNLANVLGIPEADTRKFFLNNSTKALVTQTVRQKINLVIQEMTHDGSVNGLRANTAQDSVLIHDNAVKELVSLCEGVNSNTNGTANGSPFSHELIIRLRSEVEPAIQNLDRRNQIGILEIHQAEIMRLL